jgi:ATP-dependent DNA helicase RecG
MTELELRELISNGEGYHLEFKEESVSPDSIKKTIVCFANTDGGKILVGVSNDKSISGVSNVDRKMLYIENIAYNNCEPPITILQETVVIEDKKVIVVNIPQGTQRPYRTNEGKYYIRSTNQCRDASREELLRIFQASEILCYDEIPVSRAKFYDLDLNIFLSFIKEYLNVEISNESDIQYYLKNFHLVNSENIPTVSGILFFGKNSQTFISQARIICAAISDKDIAVEPFDRKEISSNIPQMITDCERFLKIHLTQKHEIKDFEKEVKEEIPFTALREAIVNAIAHRDYTINQAIRVLVFSDRVEIRSPGILPNTVTVDSMRVGGSHVLRNPTIYNMLYKYKMVTDLGSGVRRIIMLFYELNYSPYTTT